jgi:2-hydroxychromene-2-carboxylate isomerase
MMCIQHQVSPMTLHVDYYFTPVSPWAFLGHKRFVQLLSDAGASVSVRPVDFAAIFPASGGLPLAKRAPQRQAYRLVELKRFADAVQVPLNPQPKFFPVPSDPAALLLVAASQLEGEHAALELAGRFGTAVWVEQRDIGDVATRRAIVAEAGLPDDLHTRAAAPDIADRYAAYTRQALDAGVFGAPSYVVDGEIFWGQDRLDFLAQRLRAEP